MKKLFRYIASLWIKIINLFKKKKMPIEKDIEDLVNTFISNNRNVFGNLIQLNYGVKATFNKLNQSSYEVILKFSTSFSTSLETQLTFSNLNKNYVLDITDGICNFKNSISVHRNAIYHDVDFLNNRLWDKYESIFLKYHP